MSNKYSRLHRKADPFDFLTPYQEEIYHLNKPQLLDTMNKEDMLVPGSSEETVTLDETDPMIIASTIQDVFTDLYGINLPKDLIDEVVDSLPLRLPNSIDSFQDLLARTFRKLKVYDWVDTQRDEDVLTPQDFASDIDQLVDSGDLDGIDEGELDDVNDDAAEQRASANKINNLIRKANRIRDRREENAINGYSGSRRSIGDVASDPRNRVYHGEDGIMDAYAEIVSDPDIAIWDVGLPKSAINKVRSAHDAWAVAGGGSSGSQSWISAMDNATVGAEGFPIINCDGLGGS